MNYWKKLNSSSHGEITVDHVIVCSMMILLVLAVLIWMCPQYKNLIEKELHKKVMEQSTTAQALP